MTTCQARKIRSGVRLANMCWDLTRLGGLENEYFLETHYGTRIAMGGLRKRAFDAQIKKLRAKGKVAQR